MYPIASRVASFTWSFLPGSDAFAHKLFISSGQRLSGSSADAIPAMQDAADEGFDVSVPSAWNTLKEDLVKVSN